MSKKVYKNEKTVIGPDGAVTTTQQVYSLKLKSGEEFYMTYLSFMQHLLRIKSMIDVHVLTKFCSMMQFNSNQVFITTGVRKAICAELNLHNSNLSAAIRRLRDLGLISGEEGTFEINPIVVWKGTTETREQLLKERGLQLVINLQVDNTGSSDLLLED